MHTEFASDVGFLGIRSPFSVRDVVLVVDIETESLGPLTKEVSLVSNSSAF